MPPNHDKAMTEQRIAKFLAHAGVCSRRAAEKLILDGKVSVNGKIIDSPALNVTEKDLIEISGKKIKKKERTRLWRYHKPAGLLCTRSDPEGRPTIFEALAEKKLPYTVSVGRLDLNSEGLLLLTNDGDFSRFLELPAHQHERTYRVRVKGLVKEDDLKKLEKGMTIDGVRYLGVHTKIERHQSSNTWLQMTLQEGKNREIRRLMDHLGYAVNRLIRISYGPFYLGKLERGDVEEVPAQYIKESLNY
jgi:23S rRNA pseudouridine2605 synthase